MILSSDCPTCLCVLVINKQTPCHPILMTMSDFWDHHELIENIVVLLSHLPKAPSFWYFRIWSKMSPCWTSFVNTRVETWPLKLNWSISSLAGCFTVGLLYGWCYPIHFSNVALHWVFPCSLWRIGYLVWTRKAIGNLWKRKKTSVQLWTWHPLPEHGNILVTSMCQV